MSIAIILGTHGNAAEQLLLTTEMILGKQDNVGFIDFVPGENAQTLEKKYETQLSSLKTEEGILFLVDMWGGSPFNAASSLIKNKKNADIVTGVNIPMLIEVFMARDDELSLDEIVTLAQESVQTGVKIYSRPEGAKKADTEPKVVPQQVVANTMPSKTGHLDIKLARIDDRLIHGQVATRWTKETGVKRIIVVDDDVAKDNVRVTLLKEAAPPGVTSHVVDVAKMIRVYNNPMYAKERTMLLFTNPASALALINGGVEIKSINIGGMAFKPGKTQVSDAVSVDATDIKAFEELHQKGIELEFRKVASDSRVNLMDLLKKV